MPAWCADSMACSPASRCAAAHAARLSGKAREEPYSRPEPVWRVAPVRQDWCRISLRRNQYADHEFRCLSYGHQFEVLASISQKEKGLDLSRPKWGEATGSPKSLGP